MNEGVTHVVALERLDVALVVTSIVSPRSGRRWFPVVVAAILTIVALDV